MYQRYYDGYNFCEETKLPTVTKTDKSQITSPCDTDETPVITSTGKSKFLEADDILLIGVLILLLNEDCNDKALILIIGFLLLSGFINI